VAKTRIQVGEEVTDCYGIHHLSIEKATRLSTLQKSFLFSCQCKVRGVRGGCYLSIEKATRLSTLQKSFLFNLLSMVRVRWVRVDVIFPLRRPRGSPLQKSFLFNCHCKVRGGSEGVC
jgi:hypothetical protein